MSSSSAAGALPSGPLRRGAPAGRWAFVAAAALLVAAGLVPVLWWGGNLDAAWYLYVARRMLSGARLYRDIVEVNPPLIVALSIPPAWVARALGVLDLAVYNVSVALLAVLSVAFAGRLLARLPDVGATARRVLLLVFLTALFPLAAADFGQREHLLLALLLPYLCLSAVRAERGSASRAEAIGAGVMAAVGLALKPFYLPLWVAVEAYLAWARRAGPPWRRTETVAIAVTLALYAASVVPVAPAYVALVHRLGPLYTDLLRRSPAALLATRDGVLPLLAAAALAVTPAAGGRRALRDLTIIGAVAALLAVLLQRKGWSYHYYPSRAESLVALGLAALSWTSRPAAAARARVLAAALAPLLLAAALVVVVVQRGREAWAEGEYERVAIRGEMVPLVHRYAEGRPILALAVSPTPAFPLVNFARADWALRFPSLWMIPALHARGQWVAPVRGGPPARPSAEQQYLIDAVTEDFVEHRPALLLQYAPPWGAPDLIGYFASADPRFAAELSHYRPVADVAGYRFYARNAEVPQ